MENTEQTEVEQTEVEQDVIIDNEKVADSIFSKMKDFFSIKDDKVEINANEEQIKSLLETDEAKKLIEEEASKKANAKVTEILPNAKKEKEQELKQGLAELEKQKQELEINKSLEQVDDNFKDFVKHQTQQLNVSVDEYLSENKQYLKNQKASQTKLETSKADNISLSQEDKKILESFSNVVK